MQKIIVIGETALNVIFPADRTWPLRLEASPAGPLFNAAAAMALRGNSVSFVSDAGRDFVGQLLVDYLATRNVDTSCIDRFAAEGGSSPAYFISGKSLVPHCNYPAGERFNVTWPRIDRGDIVVFGGYFAVSPRTSRQVAEIIAYARQMKAVLVYSPGFEPSLEPQITRVMPALLDNLELADITLTRTSHLRHIFNDGDPAHCYANRIAFYCPTLVNIDTETSTVQAFHGHSADCATYSAPGASSTHVHTAAVTAVVGHLLDGKEASSLAADTARGINSFNEPSSEPER